MCGASRVDTGFLFCELGTDRKNCICIHVFMRGLLRRAACRMLSTTSTKPALRGVVFDIDGTLTVPNLDFKEMYSRCGVAMSDDILQAVAAKPPTERAAAEATIEEMEDESRRTLELMSGAANVVAWLHARNVPTAVVTRNTAKTIAAVTQHIAADEVVNSPCFVPAISRDDTFPSKPNPACFEHIAAAWGVDLHAAATSGERMSNGILMVGDSPSNDVAFGMAANAATVLLDTGRRHVEGGTDGGADFVVASLTELPALLKEQFADVPPLQKYTRAPPLSPPPVMVLRPRGFYTAALCVCVASHAPSSSLTPDLPYTAGMRRLSRRQTRDVPHAQATSSRFAPSTPAAASAPTSAATRRSSGQPSAASSRRPTSF